MRKYRICYSLNQAAFIMHTTGVQPGVFRDTNGLYYAVYDETPEVKEAVAKWHTPDLTANLHEYVACYAVIRKTIAAKRKEDAEKEKAEG